MKRVLKNVLVVVSTATVLTSAQSALAAASIVSIVPASFAEDMLVIAADIGIVGAGSIGLAIALMAFLWVKRAAR